MAAGDFPIGQLTTINNRNLSGAIADELFEDSPFLRTAFAVPASNGDRHQWLRYDDAAPAGFRALNDGIVQGHAQTTNVTRDCKIVDCSFTIDTRAQSGYALGDLIQRQSMMHLRTAMFKVEQQIFNGTTGSSASDANGFLGLTDSAYYNQAADDQVTDAGGTTNLTSVWLIRSMFNEFATVLGNDGDISISPAVRQRVPGSTGHYGAWFVDISSWYAIQDGGKLSAARIANVDSAATTPVVTDDLIAREYAKFPAGRKPNLLVMNRAADAQLRESRTATNATGAPAGFVESVYGMTVVVTDGITNAETQVT